MRPGTDVKDGCGTSWVGLMNRISTIAMLAALAAFFALPAEIVSAQSASGVRVAQLDAPWPYRRPQARLRVTPYEQGVIPHYNPGPNAVRVCNATYVQEYRPSGTVIVPHMICYWSR
jgi:hypothetical protein